MFVSYGFVHGGPVHVAVNMVTLWSLGRAVLDWVGGRGLVLVYGVAGALMTWVSRAEGAG
jgi:membrane associated rhomboid family serine protease